MQAHRIPVVPLLALTFALMLPVACGRPAASFGPEQRFTARQRPIEWNTPDATRLQLRAMSDMGAQDPHGAQDPQGPAGYSAPTPAGWKQLAADPAVFKDLNFEVAGNADAICYLTGSVMGGFDANVDRWYGQMGATPPADFAALPKHELLGQQGTLVEIEGPWRSQPGYKSLGLITARGQEVTTLRMIGPKAVVDAEKERFLQLAKAIRRGAPAAQPAAAGSPFLATTPPGWRQLAAEPAVFKDLNFAVGSGGEAECYLTASVMGGVDGNVERWYGQMQAAAPGGGSSQLPQAELLGKRGPLVAIEGTYKGRAGMKLVGIVVGEGQQCSTLKLIGPKAVVDAEQEHFLQLAKSIRVAAAAPAVGPQPHGAGAPGQQVEPKGPIQSYKVPAGWRQVESQGSMRLFTFQVGKETELSVVVLGGTGGGTRPNLDRWRQQMGQAPLTDAEFAALAQVDVLGAKVPLLELRGKFSDGMTGRAFNDAAFLGVVSEQPEGALFFKFTGPHAEASAHRQEFLDFCASLRR